MPWVGLAKVRARGVYKNLILRFEDSDASGWLVRLYDGDTMIAEASAEDPQHAVSRLVEVARRHLQDPGVSADSFNWVQL
jgi:hypothetical protein